MSVLVVISAPSGAGKTTICRRLLDDFPWIVLSVSCTTRAPRGGEQHGREYYFLSKQDFEDRIKGGEFAEWAVVHGFYYGTLRTTIEDALGEGGFVLLDIDVQGAASLRKAYPRQCIDIFIAPPTLGDLENRLRARGTDSEEVIQRRLNNAKAEMKRAGEFRHIVVNDVLDRAYSEVKSLLTPYLGGALLG